MQRGAKLIGRKHNDAVSAPRTAKALRCVAERGRQAARDFDLLELALGEEPDGAAIRRPERKSRALRARKRLPLGRIKRIQPEARIAFRDCYRNQARPIGRNGESW